MKKVGVLVLIFLVGCVHQPIIDTKGVNMAQYDVDLKECQAFADQRNPAANAAVGAVGGAILGAAITSLFGGSRQMRNTNSMAGALGGVAGAGGGTIASQRRIVYRCMAGRGYNVLD